VLCGYEILPPTRNFGTFEKWMAEVRKVNFEQKADELLKALKEASDGEALDVLLTIGAAMCPQEGMRRG